MATMVRSPRPVLLFKTLPGAVQSCNQQIEAMKRSDANKSNSPSLKCDLTRGLHKWNN